jgi:hypothetical protein
MTEPPVRSDAWVSPQTRDYAESVLAPLERGEADTAVRAALTMVGVAVDRARVFPPEVRIEKPSERNGAPMRLVRVRIRDRDRRLVHEVTVQDGSPIDHIESEEASPPFSDEEREDGTRALSGDSRVGELLADTDVEVEWFSAGRGRDRLLGARFVRVDGHAVVGMITTAVVDVDSATLVQVGDRSE